MKTTGALGAMLCAVLLSLGCCRPPAADDAPAGGGTDILSWSLVAPAVEGAVDPASRTVGATVPAGTDLTALVARFVTSGERVSVAGQPQESGITANDFTVPVAYVVTAADGSMAAWTVTVTRDRPPSAEKAITALSFLSPRVDGVVDPVAREVRAVFPQGTDVTALVACFDTTGVAVRVGGVLQVSGLGPHDYTRPVTWLVAAEDGTTAEWTVIVTVEPGTEKVLVAFGFPALGAAGVIDQESRIVRVRVPPGTDLAALVAEFSATGASVRVGGVVPQSGVTAHDYTGPVTWTVTAEDGSTADYQVRVAGAIGLLVNELDVDQPGTDTAEFVELYAREDVDAVGLLLVLVNGSVSPGQEYARVDLSAAGDLPAGTYLVVSGPGVTTPPAASRIQPAGWTLSNRVQNGPSDAVVIWDALGGRIVDTVAYGGALHRALLSGVPGEVDLTEGELGAPSDTGSGPGAIARSPDGQDTGSNAADFRFTPVPTPGAPNP